MILTGTFDLHSRDPWTQAVYQTWFVRSSAIKRVRPPGRVVCVAGGRMNAVVTGGAGFIGRHLVKLLRERGHLVTCWDLAHVVDRDSLHVVGDLAGPLECSRAIMRALKPDVVYHLAGRVQGDVADVWRANVQGTVNLLDAVKHEAPTARVVVVGTAAEYGRPKSDEPLRETDQCHPRGAYGTSKHAAVLAALDFASDVDVVVARPFNLIGAGMGEHLAVGSMIASIKRALATPCAVTGRGLELSRDFLAVQDLARALEMLARLGKRGEVYNVCSGVGTSFGTLHGWLREASGLALDEEPTRPGEIPLVVGDPSKLERDTGWTSEVPLHEALMQVWEASK